MTAVPETSPIRMSVEEYLATEEASPVKREYRYGEVLAMAGGTEAHHDVAGNIYAALRPLLAKKKCKPYIFEMKVQVDPSGRFVYPDVVIACDPIEYRLDEKMKRTIINPRVIIEVMSESTREYDQGDKFRAYLTVPSVREVLFVEQTHMFVNSFYRKDDGQWSGRAWAMAAKAVPVRSLDVELPMEVIYEGVAFPSGDAS
jgi:Uma2 family endonuclease